MASKVKDYDVCILVKRAPSDLLQRIHSARMTVVLDVVDGWPQPVGNSWDRGQCLSWLREHLNTIRPTAVVAATQTMKRDIAEIGFTGPMLTLAHHARPGLQRNPIRQHVKTVGYEGSESYLGTWRKVLETQCKARGWNFLVNPPQLADLDIVVALRESTGYAPRHFKSNVKLSNAQGSGTPFIGNKEQGYLETACGAELFVDTPKELSDAFEALTSHEIRQAVSARLFEATQTLEAIASEYKSWLQTIL